MAIPCPAGPCDVACSVTTMPADQSGRLLQDDGENSLPEHGYGVMGGLRDQNILQSRKAKDAGRAGGR